MTDVDIEHLHEDILALQQEVQRIKDMLQDSRLSDEARQQLEDARAVPDDELVPHKDVVERFG